MVDAGRRSCHASNTLQLPTAADACDSFAAFCMNSRPVCWYAPDNITAAYAAQPVLTCAM
jgi:hypothetical protein